MKFNNIFNKYNMPFGRLLGSKSSYRKRFPSHFVLFNARIYSKHYYEKEKDNAIRDFFAGQRIELWYGDIDFTIDMLNLWKIHIELGIPFVITTEMGNKILEIGDYTNKQSIGFISTKEGKKLITIKDIMEKRK